MASPRFSYDTDSSYSSDTDSKSEGQFNSAFLETINTLLNTLALQNAAKSLAPGLESFRIHPQTMLLDYLEEIQKYLFHDEPESKKVFIYALIYLDRCAERMGPTTTLIQKDTLQSLLTTATLIANKTIPAEKVYNNEHVADMGGVSLELLNKWEHLFLQMMDNDKLVTEDTYDRYAKAIADMEQWALFEADEKLAIEVIDDKDCGIPEENLSSMATIHKRLDLTSQTPSQSTQPQPLIASPSDSKLAQRRQFPVYRLQSAPSNASPQAITLSIASRLRKPLICLAHETKNRIQTAACRGTARRAPTFHLFSRMFISNTFENLALLRQMTAS